MQNQTDAVFRTSKGWDGFSEKYAKKIQKNTSVFQFTLMNMVQYESADSILDAGCGAGFLHQHMVNQKKSEAHLYGFDLSEQMVKRAAARMKRYLSGGKIGSLDDLTQEEVDSANFEDESLKTINYHLSVGSVDDLSQYQNEMFDVYICNLVYQIVPDQKKAIDEAYRVLKPGGKIGITTWGNKDNCAALWFLKEVAFKVGLCDVGMSGGRFLKSAEEPINLAKEAGFINILCWEQMNPFDVLDVKHVDDFFNPEIDGLFAKADEQQKQKYFEALDEFIKEFRNKNLPLPFDCYLLVAEKPK